MKLYDISMPISVDMSVFKNDPSRRPELITVKNIEQDGVSISKIILDLHTGTHIDAPRHYFEEGSTIDTIKMTQEVCKAQVLDLTKLKSSVITKADLEAFTITPDVVVLLKTINSNSDHYDPDFVYLEASGAEYLSQLKIRGVGIDAMTLERNQPEHESHKAFLSKDLLIIEGLRLKHIQAGLYTMIALPIKIVGAEAAPTRVLLVEGL